MQPIRVQLCSGVEGEGAKPSQLEPEPSEMMWVGPPTGGLESGKNAGPELPPTFPAKARLAIVHGPVSAGAV